MQYDDLHDELLESYDREQRERVSANQEQATAQGAATKPRYLTQDDLNTIVTSAIRETEVAEEKRVSAYKRLSELEEQLADRTPITEPEGRIARRGAVRAAMKGGDVVRAQYLAKKYFTEKDCPDDLRESIGLIIRHD